MNYIFLWISHRNKEYMQIIGLTFFIGLLIFSITIVSEGAATEILSNTGVTETNDILVQSSNSNLVDIQSKELISTNIESIVQNKFELTNSVVNLIEFDTYIMETRANNSLAALEDQRQIYGKLYIIDDSVWDSLTDVMNVSILYATSSINLRFINGSIQLPIGDNVTLAYSQKNSIQSNLNQLYDFLLSNHISSTADGIVFMQQSYFLNQIATISTNDNIDILHNNYWSVFFDYEGLDLTHLQSATSKNSIVNNEIFNYLILNGQQGIQILFPYQDKLQNIESNFFSNLEFVYIFINVIVVISLYYLISFIQELQQNFSKDKSKINMLTENESNNLITDRKFAFIHNLLILGLPPLLFYVSQQITSLFGLKYNIMSTVLSIYVMMILINRLFIFARSLLSELSFFLLSTLLFVIFYFVNKSSNQALIIYGFSLFRLLTIIVFNYFLLSLTLLILTGGLKRLFFGNKYIMKKNKVVYHFTISNFQKNRYIVLVFMTLLLVSTTGVLFLTEARYQKHVMEYNIGADVVVEGFSSLQSVKEWIDNNTISGFTITANILSVSYINGIYRKIDMLFINQSNYLTYYQLNDTTQSKINDLNSTIAVQATLGGILGFSKGDSIFFENNLKQNFSTSISSTFNYWSSFVPENQKFDDTDLYMVTSLHNLDLFNNASIQIISENYAVGLKQVPKETEFPSDLTVTVLANEIAENGFLKILNYLYYLTQLLSYIFLVVLSYIICLSYIQEKSSLRMRLWVTGYNSNQVIRGQRISLILYLITLETSVSLIIFLAYHYLGIALFSNKNPYFLRIVYDISYLVRSFILFNLCFIGFTYLIKGAVNDGK